MSKHCEILHTAAHRRGAPRFNELWPHDWLPRSTCGWAPPPQPSARPPQQRRERLKLIEAQGPRAEGPGDSCVLGSHPHWTPASAGQAVPRCRRASRSSHGSAPQSAATKGRARTCGPGRAALELPLSSKHSWRPTLKCREWLRTARWSAFTPRAWAPADSTRWSPQRRPSSTSGASAPAPL